MFAFFVSFQRTYIFAFLLSARLYVKPHTLLGQVCQVRKSLMRKMSPDSPDLLSTSY